MEHAVREHVLRIIIVAPTGRIDAFSVQPWRDRFEQHLAAGETHFVIDLSDVTFLDSAGMAALVSLLKRSREAGGDVRLVWPVAEGARRILDLTKLDRVFRMASSVEETLPQF